MHGYMLDGGYMSATPSCGLYMPVLEHVRNLCGRRRRIRVEGLLLLDGNLRYLGRTLVINLVSHAAQGGREERRLYSDLV